jgi:hypothetical protein
MRQHLPAVRVSRAVLTLALWLAALGLAPPAHAWKPITHVYLAEEAREAMVAQGGRISIEEVDFWRRDVVGPVGTYPISSEVYQALRDYPSYFRAGVLGPDAYPDMIFGQTVIHPNELAASGANRWLSHLYSQARTPQERAFVWGFLGHAAGDMFGHTFVNKYAGGNFTLAPIDNAIRHIVVEGYVGRFTPPLRAGSYTIETTAVNGFLYENLINAQRSRDGQTKNTVWQLIHDNPQTRYGSLPALFTRLREGLKDKVAAHYDLVRSLRENYKEAAGKCGLWRPVWCTKAVYYKALLWANQLIGGLAADYLDKHAGGPSCLHDARPKHGPSAHGSQRDGGGTQRLQEPLPVLDDGRSGHRLHRVSDHQEPHRNRYSDQPFRGAAEVVAQVAGQEGHGDER